MRKFTAEWRLALFTDLLISQCFYDKAIELEVAKATVRCNNSGCPWEGLCVHHQVGDSILYQLKLPGVLGGAIVYVYCAMEEVLNTYSETYLMRSP